MLKRLLLLAVLALGLAAVSGCVAYGGGYYYCPPPPSYYYSGWGGCCW